jgi:hypothetical protein
MDVGQVNLGLRGHSVLKPAGFIQLRGSWIF